ncbi:hypothetical protein ACFSR9_12055 [Deinococcus taklimakanensis]|uniref:Uncharacterized protein n=1 Tax=Deinococcus taklimakanensis TaxID=536443 RepID=A0ABW5P4C7_9DEIO
MTIAALLLAPTAFAETVDCDSVSVGSYSMLTYKIPATFPNPSKTEYKSLEIEPASFKGCGYEVTSDTRVISIKADSRQGLFKLLGMDKMKEPFFAIPFVGFSGYKYPSLKMDFYSYNVWFTYAPGSGQIDTFDYDAETRAVNQTLKSASAGYKVDGGPLTPFYYEGVITKAKLPTTTKTIDFYAMRGTYSNGYDRILIDLSNNSVTLWKKYDFPKS